MKESFNIYDLLGKIDWEGGITSVLDYGIRDIDDYDVLDELKDAWLDMVSYYSDFEEARNTVHALMKECEREYSNNKEF